VTPSRSRGARRCRCCWCGSGDGSGDGSAYDARTHLPGLLGRAARGERFVITRHGKPVAQLIPFEAGDDAAIREAIVKDEAIRARLGRGTRLELLDAFTALPISLAPPMIRRVDFIARAPDPVHHARG